MEVQGVDVIRNGGIAGFLVEHAGTKPVSFHMPGHKGSGFFRRLGYGHVLDSLVDMDVTEITGADNLFQPESTIAETMEKYKALYGSRASYILVNGTSSGLIAAIMATTEFGGSIVMARNSHKSIFNGAAMQHLTPVYAYPETMEEYGVTGEIKPEEIERCIRMAPKAGAVILPSPNYYGICSDVEKIAEICHRNGKVLIVDQAHGAHLSFSERSRLSADDLGADIVVESIHKTLAAFTQSAVINVHTESVDLTALEEGLQKMESTSPSYILMASLDMNADIIGERGEELMSLWEENLDRFYERAEDIPGLMIMEHPLLDRTKINLDMSSSGLDGPDLQRELEKRGIFPELATGNILMCMTGIGNTEEDYLALAGALKDISEGCEAGKETERTKPPVTMPFVREPKQHPLSGRRESVNVDRAAGRICAQAIIPYPPGIPLVCPGEMITAEQAEYVKNIRARGEKVMGVTDSGMVLVDKE